MISLIMARKPLIFPRLSLLFLLCSSCAWVGNGTAYGPVPVVVEGREVVGGAGGAGPLWRRIPGEVEGRDGQRPRSPPAAEPAHVVRDGCESMITPPPSLLSRQDQGQIQALSNQLQQLSQQSRSVSQASQQVSQSSQQLSQSLQQATQRLSQTEQQLASARLQQNAAESASRSISQASAEASRRANEARASAERDFSQSMASVTGSMDASFSSALRLATQSAAEALRSAANVAQQAQADATALRNQASTQIQQAQGAALSVTQTALAIVGGIIGSSLLTGVAFVLVLRHRRKKRRQLRRGNSTSSNENMNHPHLKAYSVASKKGYAASDDDGSSTYSTDDPGFKFPSDIKQPAPAAAAIPATVTGIPRKNVTSGVGYALSYSRPRPSMSLAAGNLFTVGNSNKSTTSTKAPPQFQLGNPPPPRGAAATAGGETAGGGKFSLFPSSRTNVRPTSPDEQGHAGGGPQQQAASASASGAGGGGGGLEVLGGRGQQRQQQPGTQRMSNGGLPSLDRWLRDRTDVSPFSTLKGGGGEASGGR